MKKARTWPALVAGCLIIVSAVCASGGGVSKALDTIKAEDMKFAMQFLSAPEFRGRNTPSAELDIASKYIALAAERIGLKPLMPGGSYYQEVPVEVTTVDPNASRMRLLTAAGERDIRFPKDATVGRGFEPGKGSGEVGFLDFGLSAPQLGWDDCADVDLKRDAWPSRVVKRNRVWG